jgi:hypothetical protein
LEAEAALMNQQSQPNSECIVHLKNQQRTSFSRHNDQTPSQSQISHSFSRLSSSDASPWASPYEKLAQN